MADLSFWCSRNMHTTLVRFGRAWSCLTGIVMVERLTRSRCPCGTVSQLPQRRSWIWSVPRQTMVLRSLSTGLARRGTRGERWSLDSSACRCSSTKSSGGWMDTRALTPGWLCTTLIRTTQTTSSTTCGWRLVATTSGGTTDAVEQAQKVWECDAPGKYYASPAGGGEQLQHLGSRWATQGLPQVCRPSPLSPERSSWQFYSICVNVWAEIVRSGVCAHSKAHS